MDNAEKEPRINIRAIMALILLGGMLIYFSMTMAMNDRIKNDLTSEKLRSELLLSEKLSEQKENFQLAEELKQADEKYMQVRSNLKSALDQLALKEKELKKTKAGTTEDLGQKRKDEIKTLNEKIKTDAFESELKLNQANAYSSVLESKVSDKKNAMEQYVQAIERLTRLRINHLKIETIRKNNKLTSKASRAKIIKVNLQVSDQLENLTFQIIDPSGKQLLSTEKNSSLIIKDHENVPPGAFILSPELQLNSFEKYKTVEIVYTPINKLTAGVYRITVLNEQETIGNCFLRLE